MGRLNVKTSYRKRRNIVYEAEYKINNAKTLAAINSTEVYGTFTGVASHHDRAVLNHLQGSWGVYDDPTDETPEVGVTAVSSSGNHTAVRPDTDCEWSQRQLWRSIGTVAQVVQTMTQVDDDCDIDLHVSPENAFDIKFVFLVRSTLHTSAINVQMNATVRHTIRQYYSPKRTSFNTRHQ